MDNKSLTELVINIRTDKNSLHSYLETYEFLFKEKKNSAKNILEIGIAAGGSIQLWYDYFMNANIHAIDIMNLDEVWDEIRNQNRIKLYTSTDAYNEELFNNNILDQDIKFDLIINDGIHTLPAILQFLRLYLQVLDERGIFIIEDVQEYDWIEILRENTPNKYKQYIEIYDLRTNKNRYDDILFVINCNKRIDIKYSIISFWDKFSYSENIFTNNYFNNYKYVNNYDNIEFILIGSFINENEYNIIKALKCKKILYISEPIEFFSKYTYKLYQENQIDIIFGSIENDIENNRYKFPLYLLYFNYKDKNIFIDTNKYVKNCDTSSKDFCCLINRHDNNKTRSNIYHSLKNIGFITCPSKLFNNCSNDTLNKIGNITYIRQFLFNICPENCLTTINGYITEKLLNCCLACAIPIYCGYFDEIDAKIFNKSRIIFYDPYDNNSIKNVHDKIYNLINNNDQLIKFYQQDIFCDTAYETIMDLENNILNLKLVNYN